MKDKHNVLQDADDMRAMCNIESDKYIREGTITQKSLLKFNFADFYSEHFFIYFFFWTV